MSGLVLYGASSQAAVLAEIAETQGFSLVATLSDWPVQDPAFPDLVVTGEESVARWLKAAPAGLAYSIAIGGMNGRARVEKHRALRALGLTPITLVHERAYVGNEAQVGAGCQILAFAFLGVRSQIGECVVLNSRASVDHECVLGDGVHIGPGATLAGRVRIGEYAFIGTGATVCPDVTIVANVIVGAGAVVTGDLKEPGTYVGVPARRLEVRG